MIVGGAHAAGQGLAGFVVGLVVVDGEAACGAIPLEIRLFDALGIEAERARVLREEAAHIHRRR